MRLAPACIVAGLVGLLAASGPAAGDETTPCPESQPRPTIAIVEPRARVLSTPPTCWNKGRTAGQQFVRTCAIVDGPGRAGPER